MIDDRQKEAIELLVNTDMKYGEIADKVGVHRNTLLIWRKDKEFSEELDKIVQMRCKFLEDKIKLEADNLFIKALNLIDKAESEHVKADLVKYLMDRGLGKSTTKVEVTAKTEDNDTKDKEEFMNLLEEDNQDIVDSN